MIGAMEYACMLYAFFKLIHAIDTHSELKNDMFHWMVTLRVIDVLEMIINTLDRSAIYFPTRDLIRL